MLASVRWALSARSRPRRPASLNRPTALGPSRVSSGRNDAQLAQSA